MATLVRLHAAATVPPQSAARGALAEAIAARDAANVRLSGLHGVADRATRNVRAAQEALDVAQGGVDAARAADGRAATDALLAGTATPPASLPAARAAMVACEDALAAATTARDALQAEIAELTAALPIRQMRVDDCAVAVLREEADAAVRALLAEIEALHKQVADRGLALQWLTDQRVVIAWGADAMPGVGELQSRFTMPPRTWILSQHPDRAPSRLVWEAALAALKIDAAAPVPK